jgi:hypothetical protein
VLHCNIGWRPQVKAGDPRVLCELPHPPARISVCLPTCQTLQLLLGPYCLIVQLIVGESCDIMSVFCEG